MTAFAIGSAVVALVPGGAAGELEGDPAGEGGAVLADHGGGGALVGAAEGLCVLDETLGGAEEVELEGLNGEG